MPHQHKTIAYAVERRAIARMFIALERGMRVSLREAASVHLDNSIMVALAVIVGHVDGRPMNATKISHYLDMPRTTVLRKLELLIKHRIVDRSAGATYIVGASLQTSTQMATYMRAFEEAERELQSSPLHRRPDRTPAGFTHKRASNTHHRS